MNTLLLDRSTWDLLTDANGNIAMASDPYSVAQDVASAIRLFAGELWYDTTQGVPYFAQILGKFPPLSLVRAKIIAAALTVPEVTACKVYFSSFQGRTLSGQALVTTASGETLSVGF